MAIPIVISSVWFFAVQCLLEHQRQVSSSFYNSVELPIVFIPHHEGTVLCDFDWSVLCDFLGIKNILKIMMDFWIIQWKLVRKQNSDLTDFYCPF